MKRSIYKIFFVLFLSSTLLSCSKEETPVPTDELGFEQLFSPAADASPEEKELFEKYKVWVRMDFKSSTEVYNSYLGNAGAISRFPVEKIKDEHRKSAYVYMDVLLSNISKEYGEQLMPNEIFFIEQYGNPFMDEQFLAFARNRLLFVWPNRTYGTQSVVDMEEHYYRDSVLTRAVWGHLSKMIGSRITEEIPGFEQIGKPYDGGAAFNKIRDQFQIDKDMDKRDEDWQKLADQGGYLNRHSTTSFNDEYAAFFNLLILESYENIDKKYLQGNDMRRQKYNVFVKYFKDKYNWDIQAAGNKYREKLDSFQ